MRNIYPKLLVLVTIIITLLSCDSPKQETTKLVITKLRTRSDLAKLIAKTQKDEVDKYLNYLNNNDSLATIQADTNTIMALILPNTYQLYKNATVSKTLKKITEESKTFWNSTRTQQAATLGLTTTQVVTLASIVEEETNNPDDKGKVASVYLNRLKRNMKLEADPTLKYALKDFGLKRVLNVHKELAKLSPYSTYANTGLPPGPICTPALSTINAVLTAPISNYIFFVAQPNFSGLSNFAADYAQHNVYAKQYQKFLDSIGITKKRSSAKTP